MSLSIDCKPLSQKFSRTTNKRCSYSVVNHF